MVSTSLSPLLVLKHSEDRVRHLRDKTGRWGDYTVEVGATDVKLFHGGKPVAEANDSRVKVWTREGAGVRGKFEGTTDTVGEYRIDMPPQAEMTRDKLAAEVGPAVDDYVPSGVFHWYPEAGRWVNFHAIYELDAETRNQRGDMLAFGTLRMQMYKDPASEGVDVEFYGRDPGSFREEVHLGDTVRHMIIATGLRVAFREREMQHRVRNAGRGGVDEAADEANKLARKQAAPAVVEPAKTDKEHHHHHHSHETKKEHHSKKEDA